MNAPITASSIRAAIIAASLVIAPTLSNATVSTSGSGGFTPSGSKVDFYKPTCAITVPANNARVTHAGFKLKGISRDAQSGVNFTAATTTPGGFFYKATGAETWKWQTPRFHSNVRTARVLARSVDNAGNKSKVAAISVKVKG